MGDYRHHDRNAETQFGQYLSQVERDTVLKAHQMAPATVVLDVGAAGGRWSELLRAQGWRIICTDVNALSIERCRERMPDATCILVDPADMTLPCGAESVGMVICIEVFMVMPTPWFTAEVARVLKPNGILVGEFNNKWSWRGYLHHIVTKFRGGFDYYGTAYRQWKKDFRRAGFVVEFEQGLSWLPFGRHSNSWLIKPLARLEKALGFRSLPNLSPSVIFIARKVDAEQA